MSGDRELIRHPYTGEVIAYNVRIPNDEPSREAADRLAALDNLLIDATTERDMAATYIRALDALRLPCPHPGCEQGWVRDDPTDDSDDASLSGCPDCTPPGGRGGTGRMSHERAWKIVAAVYAEIAHYDAHYPNGDGLTEVGRACRELVNRLAALSPSAGRRAER